MAKVHEWKCPVCGKVIESLYMEQFKQNKKIHILKHETDEGKYFQRDKPKPIKELEEEYEQD